MLFRGLLLRRSLLVVSGLMLPRGLMLFRGRLLRLGLMVGRRPVNTSHFGITSRPGATSQLDGVRGPLLLRELVLIVG